MHFYSKHPLICRWSSHVWSHKILNCTGLADTFCSVYLHIFVAVFISTLAKIFIRASSHSTNNLQHSLPLKTEELHRITEQFGSEGVINSHQSNPFTMNKEFTQLRSDVMLRQTQSRQTQSHNGIPTRKNPAHANTTKTWPACQEEHGGLSAISPSKILPGRTNCYSKSRVINGHSCYVQSTVESDARILSQIF